LLMPKETDPYNAFPQEKNLLLCLAAIFEGEFSIDWLEELTGMKASLILSVLEEGVQEQRLTRKKPAIYAFRSTQKRQEWISALADNEKERYRRNIANILIRELPDDDSKALEIADHLLYFSNDWKGCQWLLRAGEIYIRSFATEKAIACFSKVLSDLSTQSGDNEDWLFIKAAIEYSNISTVRSTTLANLSLLQDARGRAQRLNKQSYEVLLEMHIAKYEWLRSQFDSALKRFEQALARVEELDDPELVASTTTFSTYFLFWQGRFRDVIEIYEKSVPDVERYPIGHFPLIAAVTVGRSYAMVGQLTQGLGMLDTIRDYCLQKGDLYLAAHAGCSIAMTMLSINQLDDAFRYLRSSLKEAKQSRNYWAQFIVTFMLALAHYKRGDKEQSLQYLRGFLQNSREADVTLQLHPYLMEICWAMEMGDLPPIPGLSLEQGIDQTLKVRNTFINGIAYRYQALLGKSKGWPNRKIAQSLTLSARCLEESGHRIELAKTQLELTRHYVSTGNDKKAKAAMRIASEILSSTNTELIPDDLRTLIVSQNLQRAVPDEILDLTVAMAAGQDNRKLLQQIVATVNRITGAERGALLLVDEKTDPSRLQLRASKNLTIEQVYHPGFAASKQMIEEVIASGKARIFAIGAPEDGARPSEETIRSRVCVPVVLNEKIIGVLYHDNRLLGNVFRESDVKLLAYFAALAALDVERERTHQEIEMLHDRREDAEPSRERDDIQTPHVEGIIGTSPAIQGVLAQIDQVAKTDTSVLILGETGVGKNLVAAAIHRQSQRHDGPFVCVQCSALTESLITSELFGHEKGAFTGATNRRIGRFELAHGGTLFLDEIGDLSLEVQARLLRVLQSKEFERVGGGKETLTSDFRLIAATNRNLEQELKSGRFREDLYYRINVFPLHVPPLRERREDIPLLADCFFKRYTSKYGKNFDKIPQETMERLIRSDWSGNIRELENTIQRGVISGQGPHFRLPGPEVPQPDAAQPDAFRTLEENERGHIMGALDRSRWKIHGPGGAAEILNINPSTLASRMKKLGIRRPPTGPLKPLR
jgi:formate hydrogenlyase transcriptional activator